MAKSFAQYASQFLTHQSNLESSLSSSQPLFFSFTTDEGSRLGNNHDSDLDDLDDPHLRASYASRTSRRDGHDDYRSRVDEGDDDDPYLRLDEDDLQPGASRYASQSIPLISSEYSHPGSPEYPKGWLAHQASPLPHSRTPSPAPSSSSLDSHRLATDIFKPTHNNNAVHPQASPPPPPPPLAREPISLSLTESLLPRDGTSRPVDVFSLPDPRYVPRGRRRYNDSVWTALWCTGVSLCVSFSVLLLFLTQKPARSPVNFPYTTMLHTVPMITIITFLSAIAAYTHILLLRIFVRPVMVVTSVFIPATLFISAVWAFVGSFMWETGQEPTWGETVGLRLFSLVPLILSIITARRLIDLPRDIHTTSSILDLTTRLLLSNPFLLALSPAILLVTLVASIPFLTLVFRLLLIGYLQSTSGGLEWHVKGWAHWAIFGAISIWLWSWGVARGTLRTTCAGVIGAWYFADLDLPPPLPSDTRTIHAALTRSTQPSLGSIILAALILTGIRILALLTVVLRLLPSYLPLALRPWLQPLTVGAGFAVGWLEGVTSSLSKYALVYTGLTGDAFFPSARRARALTAAVESRSAGSYRRKFKTEPPLTMLTYSPLTLTFPFALMTYLFVAHTLSAPDQALGAALLAGGVTALVGLFCVGLVKDTADTLYVCYCIDKDLGEKHRDEVFSANPPQPQSTRLGPSSPSTPPKQQYKQHTPRHLSPQPNVPLIHTSPTPLPSRSTQPQPPVQVVPSSVQTTVPESDIDPFEQEPIDFPISMPGPASQPAVGASSKRDVVPYTLSPEPRRRDEDSDDADEDGDESQIFPGSGLF
ncbi:hypothetical protein SERLA73DRAFT_76886 [Serpula lacrymans var. lacrymans S7.3]|uniref:Plasma-membrane choline transporter-domain-containing protein n=1 Tax=Serpula lacrymans var. lacrymans (strain S7.3) TaxID=936435 RepID=F8Q8E2_SERL3|nr:hypothetical protein SERLA73DRAFT_76886 [Serpula lacrymans var. lacrymans S7.3]